MKYAFDEIIERRGTGCVKWDAEPPSNACPVRRGSASAQRDIIPLWVADMDFAVAPAIQEAIRRRAEHPVFGYTHVQDDYYEAVISWFQRRHQWHIRREWMLYTTGVVPAMSVAIKSLTMPGEQVVILSPDYNCFFSSVKNNGCQVLETSLIRGHEGTGARGLENSLEAESNLVPPHLRTTVPPTFSIDWEDFEARCSEEKTTVFLLCNPHNPTGRVWTREELQRMADICHRHQVRIVSDEIHCELVMPGHTFVPMGTVDPDAVILNSPSKSFNIAGLMMANIICRDAATRRRLDRAININEVCDVNPFAPEAVKAAYNDSEDWIDALNLYLWDNYTVLCDFVEKFLPHWQVMPLEGTYLAWVDVSAALSTDSKGGETVAAYCDRLLQATGVWLNPGTMYGPQSGEGYLRINLACPRSLLQEALYRLSTLNNNTQL